MQGREVISEPLRELQTRAGKVFARCDVSLRDSPVTRVQGFDLNLSCLETGRWGSQNDLPNVLRDGRMIQRPSERCGHLTGFLRMRRRQRCFQSGRCRARHAARRRREHQAQRRRRAEERDRGTGAK